MSCVPTISVSGSPISVVVPETVVPITVDGSAVVVETTETSVTVEIPASSAVVVEMVERGPTGPEGPAADNVWQIQPNVVPTRNSDGYLTRLDYADGTYKVYTRDADGNVIQVTGPNADGDTVTKTYARDGDGRWAGTTTVIS